MRVAGGWCGARGCAARRGEPQVSRLVRRRRPGCRSAASRVAYTSQSTGGCRSVDRGKQRARRYRPWRTSRSTSSFAASAPASRAGRWARPRNCGADSGRRKSQVFFYTANSLDSDFGWFASRPPRALFRWLSSAEREGFLCPFCCRGCGVVGRESCLLYPSRIRILRFSQPIFSKPELSGLVYRTR